MIYRIKKWNDLYENNRTRDMKFMAWVPLPNRHDGDGYTTLIDRPNGAALFGAWVAIVQVASRCEPRGTLLRDGAEPHDSTSLSRMTRIPAKVIQEMLTVCTNECKWLEISEAQEGAEKPQEGATIPHPTDEERNGTERTERKERNRTETPLSPLGMKIGSWFNRRSDTKWTEKELKALKDVEALQTPEDEGQLLESYYLSNDPYKRRDIITLLNNWNGEIDRARGWKANPNPNAKPNHRTEQASRELQQEINIPRL